MGEPTMSKRLPAASEIVAKVLQSMGENISVDEVEAIYERNAQPLNRHERRKHKRDTKRDAKEVEKEATQFVQDTIGRTAWLVFGNYPNPPEWERPLIKSMMAKAMEGDDAALAWLKQRFPPAS
jgi:hypothetical protein